MRSNMWKRMMALACTGIMVFGGSSWSTVSVKAAEEAPSLEALSVEEAPVLEAFGVEEVKQEVYAAKTVDRTVGTASPRQFHRLYSTSYFTKAKLASAQADSITTQEAGSNGPADKVIDGNIETYWHTNYNGDKEVVGEPNNITGNNTITVTLTEPTNVLGITHTPRPSRANGIIREFKVKLHIAGQAEDQWVSPTNQNGNEMLFVAKGSEGYQKGLEEEFLFGKAVANVDKVQFIVNKAYSTQSSSSFISASELGVVTDDQTAALNDLKVILNEKIKNASVYESQELENVLNNARKICGKQDVTVPELAAELEAVKTAVENSQKTFKDEYGTGHYLSDIRFKAQINPSHEHTAMDKSCTDQPLKVNVDGQETEFIKGIGTHADNTIVYELTGNKAGHKLFTARIGIQSASNNNLGKVNFRVLMSKGRDEDADYKEVLNETDITMTNTKLIKIDITGATHLKLIVEHGKDFFNDHADWADAKLYTTLNRDNETPNLDKIIKTATALKENTVLTTTSATELDNAIVAAQKVYDDITTMPEDVKKATADLQAVVDKLNKNIYTVTLQNKAGTAIKEIKQEYDTPCTATAGLVGETTVGGWSIVEGEKVIPVVANSEYAFYVGGNIVLRATDTAMVEGLKPLLSSISVNKNDRGRADVKIVGQIVVPAGYDISKMKAGIRWSGKAAHTVDQFRKVYADSLSETYQFSITVTNCPTGKTLRSVVFVEDGSAGTVKEIRTDETKISTNLA